MRKEVTKLYHGTKVSVRDYEVEECIRRNEPMVITHKGEKMTMSLEDLKTKRVGISQKQISKIKGAKDYYMFDYLWEPDEIEI
jgi:hypothetical protein